MYSGNCVPGMLVTIMFIVPTEADWILIGSHSFKPFIISTATAWRDGAAYVGDRPTFGGETPLLEVHVFDFDGDLYGRRLRVAFVERVRGDQTFDGAEPLAAQMVADCQRARRTLADTRADDRLARPMSNPPAA